MTYYFMLDFAVTFLIRLAQLTTLYGSVFLFTLLEYNPISLLFSNFSLTQRTKYKQFWKTNQTTVRFQLTSSIMLFFSAVFPSCCLICLFFFSGIHSLVIDSPFSAPSVSVNCVYTKSCPLWISVGSYLPVVTKTYIHIPTYVHFM